MSRTDKDMPRWVTAEWYEPRHYRCPNSTWPVARRDCDLPARPVVNRGDKRTCHWAPAWEWRLGPPPRWFVTLNFIGPTRRRVRDDCRRARAEHRATGEVDVIPPTTQHRHQAHWDWW